MKINPKDSFISATRELISMEHIPSEVVVAGIKLKTHPDVFNPAVFFSSEWFANNISSLLTGEKVFVEVGCGSGVVSIKAAIENPYLIVQATDINPEATKLTSENATGNNVKGSISIFTGDVLDAIPNQTQADTIFWSLPFGYLHPEESLTGRDAQTFDPGYRAIKKFFSTARNYLQPAGRLLLGFSSDIGHFELLEKIAEDNQFSLELVTKTSGLEKDSVSMEIYEAKSLV